MNTPTTDIETRARQLYRRTGPHVDAATAGRLRAMRRRVLEARPARRAVQWMVPAGACAAALLAVVIVWQPLQHSRPITNTPTRASTPSADADMLPPDADKTDPALYQHMGFYAWLANQPADPTRHGR